MSKNGVTELSSRGLASRGRILDAAADVIARRGYAGATVGEIAKLSGSQTGTLYYHFADRDQLIEEVFLRGAAMTHSNTREVVEALPSGSTSRDRLTAALDAHIRFQLVESNYAKAVIRCVGQAPEHLQHRMSVEFRRYGRFLDTLFVQAISEGYLTDVPDRSALRMLALGAANWASEWYRIGGPASIDTISAMLTQMVFRGFGPADAAAN